MNDTNKETKPYTMDEWVNEACDNDDLNLSRVHATVEALEAATKARRCEVELALGGGFFRCDEPVSPSGNGSYCAKHGKQNALTFEAELSAAGRECKRLREEAEADRERLAQSVAEAVHEACVDAAPNLHSRDVLRALDVTRIVARVLGGGR